MYIMDCSPCFPKSDYCAVLLEVITESICECVEWEKNSGKFEESLGSVQYTDIN